MDEYTCGEYFNTDTTSVGLTECHLSEPKYCIKTTGIHDGKTNWMLSGELRWTVSSGIRWLGLDCWTDLCPLSKNLFFPLFSYERKENVFDCCVVYCFLPCLLMLAFFFSFSLCLFFIHYFFYFLGSLGSRRFCSERYLDNYCTYVQRPGDQREYRSCVYTCTGDGCNASVSLKPFHWLFFSSLIILLTFPTVFWMEQSGNLLWQWRKPIF